MVAPQVYEFGLYRLEVATRRLLRGSELVPLTPKAFDTLLALIERRDRVVDKAELMKLVWPDSFVEEANLSQTIFVLRKTLGEDRNGRPFIDTVPRRGYRFAAEARLDPDAVSRWRGARWGAAALGALIVAAAGVFIWNAARGRNAPADALAGKTRIVVLPFENLTRDHKDDWLAGAFSDSLTIGLQDLDNVIGISRDRIIELYRQQSIAESAPLDAQLLQRFSQTLGVRYYIHGSYQRLGDRIRVIARLVDNATGEVRSQESVTDDVLNLLKLEDDLASRFGSRLEAGHVSAASRADTSSLEAYQNVIEARNSYVAGNPHDAQIRLQRAVQIDPEYAAAWALLSRATARLSAEATFVSGSAADLRQSALASAQRAAALAPNLYDAHTALALAYRETGQSDLWRREAQNATALNTRLAEAYELLGDWYVAASGFGCSHDVDPGLAEKYLRTALRIDPRFGVAWANLIYHLHNAGKTEEAVRVGDQGVKTLPDSVAVRRARATAHHFSSRPADAEQEILRFPERNRSLLDRWVLATVVLLRGDAAGAAKQFDEILRVSRSTSYELSIARSYFMVNQIDEALTFIDQAVELNQDCARFAATTPAFAPYRDAPQFRARLAAWKLRP
jgi:DNA-binding winged helix-turn-helix (wHTH) protein/TolB-like protein/Tfp pilus assembly protein PilF